MTIFNSYVKLPEGSFGGHASFNFEPLTWTEQNRVSILDRSPAWSGAKCRSLGNSRPKIGMEEKRKLCTSPVFAGPNLIRQKKTMGDFH